MKVKTLILALLILCVYSFADNVDTANVVRPKDNTVYIRGIEIYGNVTTRPEVLRSFFAFDMGEPLDTAKLRVTRENLRATRLYDKVDIFPHLREDGAHVFIVLKEAVRLDLAYDVIYSTHKYGREDLWFSYYVNATVNNFRGRLEEFSLGVGVWDHKTVNLSWLVPISSTPYYISAGAGITAYPDEALPLDYTDVFARITAGRKFGGHTRLGISGIPIYRQRAVVNSMIDSAGVMPPISFPSKNEFYEVFGALSLVNDLRSARFDPRNGWILLSEIRTNRPYTGVNTPFFQFKSDLRYYHPFLLGDVAAFRLALTARDTDAGAYHRLTYGGHGEVRGYHVEELGWEFVTNSSLLASVKYYKRLGKTPQLPLPLVDMVYRGVKKVHFRFEATFMADYARLYNEPLGVITQNGKWQDGVGFGFGTRILAPEVRQSGCIDIVFGRIDEPDGDGYRWEPTLHVYLDMFF